MPDKGTAPTPEADDALARVLQPLLELSFVLTDREGFVTRWTPRAEAVFGFEGDKVTGHSLLETIGSSVQETPAAGIIEADVRHEQGHEFATELTFIPVPMSHSLEFNFFLESLESDRPREAVLRRVQSQHKEVLDWIASVVAGDKEALESDGMTAGTIVTFRAKVDTPWADLAASHGPGESRPPRPTASHGELSSAVARADEVMARSDALERNVGEATAAVEEARTKADAAHETASAAASRVAELDDENSALRAELAGARNDLAELRRELEARAGRVDNETLEALRAELADIQVAAPGVSAEEVAALRNEVEQLREAAQAGGGESAELAELREELEALRATAPPAEELISLRSELETLRRDANNDEQLARLRADVSELRSQPSAEPSEELEELRRELRELRERPPAVDGVDIEGLKEELRALRESASGSGADALELQHLKRELEGLKPELKRLRESPGEDQVAALRNDFEALRIDAAGRASSIREEFDALRDSALSNVGERQLEGLRAEVEALIAKVPKGTDSEELQSLRAELAAARAQAADVAERLRQLESTGAAGDGAREVEQALVAAREHAEAIEARIAEARSLAAEADGARREADAAKRGAEAADERAAGAAESARRHLAEMREGVESASLEGKLARTQAEAARASAEEAARYVEAARELVEALSAEAAAEEELEEDTGRAPLLGKRRTGPAREPIPGFDDASQPMARIALDGHFLQLNSGFTELVGYSETEFQSASWPPVADRAQLDHHREQMQAMLDGNLGAAEVNTGYVHAQGLLVPVAGKLSLVRDGGEPSHFLLEVEAPARAAAA